MLNIYINFLLFLELYLLIKYPFNAREERKNWYYISIFAFLIVIYLCYLISPPSPNVEIKKPADNYSEFPTPEAVFLWINRALMIILILALFILTLLIYLRTKVRGVSEEFKVILMRRHFFYLAFYSVFLCQQGLHVFKYDLINKGIIQKETFTYIRGTLNCVGILIFISRLKDPYVWNAV